MFQRTAARPLVLTVALSLSLAACDDGEDGSNSVTATDGDGTSTTGDDSTTAPGTTTTTPDPTTTGDTTGDAESTTGSAESSTGDETTGDETTGDESSSSTGTQAIGIADVVGTYIETYGPGKTDFQTHIVAVDTWTIDFGGDFGMAVHTYEEVNDNERWVAGADGAGTYTRYDWDIDDDGNLRYCSAAYQAATLQDAIDAPPSDRDDLDGIGCGGAFPWSVLVLEE